MSEPQEDEQPTAPRTPENPDNLPLVFAANLILLRHEKGWERKHLAKRSGVSMANLSYFESGQRMPTLHIAMALADALECTLDDLLREDVRLEGEKG